MSEIDKAIKPCNFDDGEKKYVLVCLTNAFLVFFKIQNLFKFALERVFCFLEFLFAQCLSISIGVQVITVVQAYCVCLIQFFFTTNDIIIVIAKFYLPDTLFFFCFFFFVAILYIFDLCF